ncbi:MAG: nucleotidyl transferase AbiEii/AbiGii toxin family protein [Deltaproteobacteria bacterium]|nr:nucleotidyl transferase AbiEii/AbiGii toxin family protein [Deltaproteobacteria bacterium]
MPSIASNEGLMLWIMTALANTLGSHAILKGGMVLRLLDCPRHTNDLDYVFVPYDSKKKIVPLMERVLQSLDGVRWTHQMHSTSVRFLISYQKFSTQIEANVASACLTEPLSTSALARAAQQTPRIIRVMRLDQALAHKIGAWNERGLLRDLYDIYFLHTIVGKLPDLPTLKGRLACVQYAKKIPKTGQSKTMSLTALCDKLRAAAADLDARAIAQQLGDYLAPSEYAGLEHKIKISIAHLVDALMAA